MDLKTRQAVARKLSKGYQKATKKEKGEILDKLVSLTGYHRKYAVEVLSRPPIKHRKAITRRKKSQYGQIFPLLKKLWAISNYASGKRLVPVISTYLDALELRNDPVLYSIL